MLKRQVSFSSTPKPDKRPPQRQVSFATLPEKETLPSPNSLFGKESKKWPTSSNDMLLMKTGRKISDVHCITSLYQNEMGILVIA